MWVSEPRIFLKIMSDKEIPREDDEPYVIDDEPDNLQIDLDEVENPPVSDEDLDQQGKHIASLLSCIHMLSFKGLIGRLYALCAKKLEKVIAPCWLDLEMLAGTPDTVILVSSDKEEEARQMVMHFFVDNVGWLLMADEVNDTRSFRRHTPSSAIMPLLPARASH